PDPVEHDGGDDLVDVQVCLEQAGDGAPDAAQHRRSDQAHIPGQVQDDGAVQRAVGAQGVLPRRADVEQAGLEGKSHRKAGHDQGGGVGQGAAHAVGGVVEAALQDADKAVRPCVLGVDGQQHQIAAYQADQDAQEGRQHADKGRPGLAAVGKHLFLIHKAAHSPFPCLRAPAMYRPSSWTVVVLGSNSPTTSPSYMTRMRSDRFITSSSSRLTSSTALPASRWATIWRWIYSMAPTSRPRVGWTA